MADTPTPKNFATGGSVKVDVKVDPAKVAEIMAKANIIHDQRILAEVRTKALQSAERLYAAGKRSYGADDIDPAWVVEAAKHFEAFLRGEVSS